MNRLITAVTNGLGWLKGIQTQRFLSVILAVSLLLTTGVKGMQDQTALGQNLRQRIEQTDRSDRPKTTGEFLDEARGDVPLDERVKNITRDSVEAFKELGKEYRPNVEEGIRDLREGAAEVGRSLNR
ncbi:MAG: hypothetical protein ACKO7W_06975 [Elainella sp.]